MILTMVCHIVFPKNERRDKIELRQCTAIDFESSWKEMTSRGELTIPRKVRYFDRHKVRETFRRGDEVVISFGYNDLLIEEFRGYISEVSADIPIVIKFEDEMFKVRKLPVNFSDPNISLDKLLKTIIPGYQIDALEGVQLGAVRLAKTQVGPVLEKLQSDWGLYTYMKGKTVVCGKYYADDSPENVADFHLEKNCVSTSLNYRKKEDISLKIKVVSTLRNGTKIEVENIGDKEGNERQLTFYNIEVKAELERLGKLEYEKYKVDRFDGSFTAFGIPSVKHGTRVNLKSSLYEDREGIYYIEKVRKTFDVGGIRQEITLGDKVG